CAVSVPAPAARYTLFPCTPLVRSYETETGDIVYAGTCSPSPTLRAFVPDVQPLCHVPGCFPRTAHDPEIHPARGTGADRPGRRRPEEHTSELQSPQHLVTRLLLER